MTVPAHCGTCAMTTRSLDLTLSEQACADLTTRDGLVLSLRPVTSGDAASVLALFDGLAREDLQFRFLSAQHHLTERQLVALVDVDHRHSEHLLAFDKASGQLAASLMVVADEHMENAEVAIAVAPEFKHRGIGWTLLRHAADLCRERGLRRIRSVESRANVLALDVERTLGFTVLPYEGDATLALVEAELN